MIKTEIDEIYNRIKNNVGFDKSKKFKKWFHDEYPYCEQHHAFGSYSQSLKTSDYCSIPVPPGHSNTDAEKNKSQFAIDNLHIILQVMIKYIKHLESKK